MIFYQHRSKPSQNEINVSKMKQFSKNYFLEKQTVEIKRKQKQSSGCFCFIFSKKNDEWPNRNELSRVDPDEGMKDEALKMNREIASKSFKNITRFKSNPRIQREWGKIKVKSPPSKGINLIKLNTRQSLTSSQATRHQQQIKKQQFNMNRLTFSAVNISYQKTVNTATTITIPQSVENGSVLDVKKLNLLKSTYQQFDVIKQQAEELQQFRKSKIMTIKQNNQSQLSTIKDIIGSDRFPKELIIKNVETSQEILSKPSSNEDIQHIIYDYSSIIIDYFNPSAEMMKKMEQHEPKLMQKNQDIFDGIDLSRINDPQQSEVRKNSSEMSEYQPRHTHYFTQLNDQK